MRAKNKIIKKSNARMCTESKIYIFYLPIYQTPPCNQASSEEDPAKGHNNVNKVLCGEHRHILETKLQSLNRL